MTATRVSWRVAEITNSFDIDCLPWGMERAYGKAGALRGLESPASPGNENQTRYKLTLAGGGATLLIHHPAGNRSSLEESACTPPIPRVSTGSLTISFPGRGTQQARARLIHKSSEADVIDQPQSQEIRPDTGTTVAHEGKRTTSYRHQPHHHTDVHQRMVQQEGRNPHADIHTGSIRRRLRILDDAHDEHEKKRQYHHYTHKPMLLGEGRENEILVGHGQKTKLGLSSFGNSLAEHPARPNRYLGLNQLVTLALRVPLGIHKTHQPRLLIVRQEVLPTHRYHDHGGYGYGGHILPTQPGEKRARN